MLSLLPLTVPEVRRLLLAATEPPERFGFRLAWSYWRRHHQAVAKRAHAARRARRPLPLPTASPPVAPGPPPASPTLSEAQWQRVRPLLPPQRGSAHGRPSPDPRTLVEAIRWHDRTGTSWRALPSHFGPWHTVHNQYLRWRNSGLWATIAALLDQPDLEEVAA